MAARHTGTYAAYEYITATLYKHTTNFLHAQHVGWQLQRPMFLYDTRLVTPVAVETRLDKTRERLAVT